jgi:hypothetical protein
LLLVTAGTQVVAHGVTRVQQKDGSVQFYQNVRLSLHGQTLWIASADHKGALEVVDGACSFVGELRRCLPYSVTLHQHGTKHVIALDRGTVFINLSGIPQALHHSSKTLAPGSVLVVLHTAKGTYISVQGKLDEVKLHS